MKSNTQNVGGPNKVNCGRFVYNKSNGLMSGNPFRLQHTLAIKPHHAVEAALAGELLNCKECGRQFAKWIGLISWDRFCPFCARTALRMAGFRVDEPKQSVRRLVWRKAGNAILRDYKK